MPAECRELALLALAESERVHRESDVRAGPVALMMERSSLCRPSTTRISQDVRLISVGIAAMLLVTIHNFKRMFAFPTVEHIGVARPAICLGCRLLRRFRKEWPMKIAEILGGAAMDWMVTIEGRDELGGLQRAQLRIEK